MVLASLATLARKPDKWANGSWVACRHQVIRSRSGNHWKRRFRAQWCSYLAAAEEVGLLKKKDVLQRLVSEKDEAFRGAMAECQAAWFIRHRLSADVKAVPDASKGKNIDLVGSVGGLEIACEVKAPHVSRSGSTVAGDYRAALRRCIKAAGKQFQKGRCNVLFLVPILRTEVYCDRQQLVGAIIGEWAIRLTIMEDGSPPPPPKETFLQNGKLAQLRNGGTDLTRISAVCALEDAVVQRGDEFQNSHRLTVVHNPFAEVPAPASFFGQYPQLVKRSDGHMEWTDGAVI